MVNTTPCLSVISFSHVGWLPDTLLAQLEDEIRRASSSKPLWEATIKKMNSDVLLMLPPTPHLFIRLGTDHSVPSSEVDP
jgi:hypothetical protein